MANNKVHSAINAGICVGAAVVGAIASIQIALYHVGYPKNPDEYLYSLAALRVVLRSSAAAATWKVLLWSFSAVTTATGACLYLVLVLCLPKEEKQHGDYGSAHWATAKEIQASGLLTPRGIVVGALRRFRHVHLLRYNGEGHVLVISPTRSGKGVTVVVPTALTWEHSAIFNDIKGELWTLTAGWRKKALNSICLRFDATCADGTAARWNPLFEIRPYPNDVRDAQNIALMLATADSSMARTENERHFRTLGVRFAKCLILHQLYVGREKTLPGCYSLATSVRRDLQDTLLLMLHAEHDPGCHFGWLDSETGKPTATHPAVAHIARDMLNKSDREQTAIVSSAVSYLELFDDPIVARNVSTSDFAISDLMNREKPVSLYLTTPVADLERVQALHRLLFTLAGTRNTEHLEFKDGRPAPHYKHPLLQVFDECFHLGYTPSIPKHFSLASGYGIYGLFVFQDLSQLIELYGRNESITSNCDVKVAFAPNNLETAAHLSKLLGTETREKESAGGNGLLGRGARREKQTIGRPLLTPDECARLPRYNSIILRNGFPPVLGEKVPYYKIPELLERSRIPPPPSDKLVPKEPWWCVALVPVLKPLPGAAKQPDVRRTIVKSIPIKNKPSPKKEQIAEGEQGELFQIKDKKSK